jgi:hypothetical protein
MAMTENGKPKTNQVHFVLQGKGGVVKSLMPPSSPSTFRPAEPLSIALTPTRSTPLSPSTRRWLPNTSTSYAVAPSTIGDSMS